MAKFLLTVLLVAATTLASQAQNYMEVIADKSCNCIGALPDTLNTEDYNIRFGLCMIDAAQPYGKQLKKEYGIRIEKLDEEAEKLGGIIGLKMATKCPNLLLKLNERLQATETAAAEEKLAGYVTKVEEELFVSFSVKESSGKTTKLYWLPFIETDLELPDAYQHLAGKYIEASYTKHDFFDPKLKEYRPFPVIKNLTVTDGTLLR